MPAEELYESQISTDPATRWKIVPGIVDELKKKAKQQGLWNLFLSKRHYPRHGVDLTNVEYGVMAEVLGRSHHFASEAVNCSAPDTGNMGRLIGMSRHHLRANSCLPLSFQRCWQSTATMSNRVNGSSLCSMARFVVRLQ